MALKKAFIFGYHGRLNFGDDVTCVTLIKTLDCAFHGALHYYVYTSAEYLKNNIDKTNHITFVSSLSGILCAILNSNFIIIDGGDHLNDYGCLRDSLKVFAAFALFALLSKLSFRKFFIINGGISAKKTINHLLLRFILVNSGGSSFRDRSSYKLASTVSKKTLLGFDTAILFEDRKNVAFASKNNIAFSITPMFNNYFRNKESDFFISKHIALDLNYILTVKRDLKITFLAVNSSHKSGDVALIKFIINNISPTLKHRINLLSYAGDVYSFARSFQQFDAIVCCKYHSIIFSYIYKKPMLIINYHPKNYQLFTELGLTGQSIVSINDICTKNFRQKFLNLLEQPDLFIPRLSINDARQRAHKGIINVLKL